MSSSQGNFPAGVVRIRTTPFLLVIEGMQAKFSMDATVTDIMMALEAVAPAYLAEEWDHVGLQVGSRRWSARRVMTALDLTPEIILEAEQRKIDVIVTHHPVFFKPIFALDLDTPLGTMLQALILNRVALLSAHTNLDSVHGGVNDTLAGLLKLQSLAVLQPSPHDPDCGLGRIGRLTSSMALKDLATMVKGRMNLNSLRFAGDPTLMIEQVAICSGSGSSLMDVFLKTEAQAFITGDVRYHEAREVESHGRGVIDIGHFESEHIVVEALARKLAAQLTRRGLDVVVEAGARERTPFYAI